MDKETLLRIKKRLEELYTQWYIASTWKDRRSRRRKIHEVSVAISNYADTLPPDILGLFDTEVERGALNAQFAGDDIGHSIEVLENEINRINPN